MKEIGIIGLLGLALLLGLTGGAQAHSTKGRMKIDLCLDAPTVDDFAYFMESYVNTDLYRGQEEMWEKRFYVKEFRGVERNGDRAVVSFVRLDTRDKVDREDSMTFERGADGIWYYHPPGQERVKVHTFVMKWGYYYQKFVLPGSFVGVVVGICVLGVMFVGRRRRRRLSLPRQSGKTG